MYVCKAVWSYYGLLLFLLWEAPVVAHRQPEPEYNASCSQTQIRRQFFPIFRSRLLSPLNFTSDHA